MHSREDTLIIQRSSAIAPTNSSLDAEAMATLLAIQQLQQLHYSNVIILGDNAQFSGKERNNCCSPPNMVEDQKGLIQYYLDFVLLYVLNYKIKQKTYSQNTKKKIQLNRKRL